MTRARAIAGLTALLIGAAAAGVYAPAADFPLVSLQDDVGLQKNKAVVSGLSAESLRWAFTETWGGSHGPLAWTSHLLDFTLFGSDAGGHHATSVALHALNAMLLFGVLVSATGALLRSAAVALLLALHPLHVEPVAWVSERAGLLCATFGFASLWCYGAHARRGSPVAQRFALVFLALSLLSKPMLVTFPLLLLLVDRWPLLRAPDGSDPAGASSAAGLAAGKWGYLLLAAAAAAVTLASHAQSPAVAGDAPPALAARAVNAVVASAAYVWKLAWPTDLAVFYPYPRDPGGAGARAPALVAAIGTLAVIVAIAWRARHPAVQAGLLWYAIALLPVLGIVPIGPQALADRYAYLPAVGIYAAIVFGAGDAIARRSRGVRVAAAVLGLALLVPLALASRAQLRNWSSSEALFRHATEVTRDNAAMHLRLASTLEGRGRIEEALEQYRTAVAIRPDLGVAHYRMANLLVSLKQPDAALAHYREALRAGVGIANDMIGLVLVAEGRLQDAISHYRDEVRRRPSSAQAHAMLARALSAAGDLPEALREYRAAAGLASEPTRWSAEIEALERRIGALPPP